MLPWRAQLAEKLENLIDEAIENHATVKMKNPFARQSYDDLGSVNIEIIPPALPPLKLPPPPPQFFNPREPVV